MDDRHLSDYDVVRTITAERAQEDLDTARRFVNRADTYLKEEGWL